MDSIKKLFYAPDNSSLAATARAHIQDNPNTPLSIASFIATTGAWPALNLIKALREEISFVEQISPVEIREQLQACLTGPHVDDALQWLCDIGSLALLFPELQATVNMKQEKGRHHKDVWEHTKLVVKQAVPRPAVRWAALFHDIGKSTYKNIPSRWACSFSWSCRSRRKNV